MWGVVAGPYPCPCLCDDTACCDIKLRCISAGRFPELEEGRRKKGSRMKRKRTAAGAGGAKSGGTDWAGGPQQPAAAQQSGDSFLRPALPLPSEWASLEVAAPPLALTPPGLAEHRALPGWVGDAAGTGLTTRGCWRQTSRVPSIRLTDSRPFHELTRS